MFIFSIIIPPIKTNNAIITEKISPVIDEKFRPVSDVNFRIASFCSVVISSPLKNPSPFKSNFL